MIFDFRISRGREGPKRFLANLDGILQTDGFSGYDRVGGAKRIHAGWLGTRQQVLLPGGGSSSRRSCRHCVGSNH